MPLAAGLRLGPYEIVAPLGAGGMGEVYKARDTRLDRTVAVKVLPAHIASREDLKQRFEREARAVSSLNHPHICVLYDIGAQDGIDFMVMEHLEGETLAARLAKGPLPLDQTLNYGEQIADALDRAHRRGVVHRDLKPANLMLTRDGVKVLDFGLAKTAPRQSAEGETLTMALTGEGMVLGTPQYMAPEQIEGLEADPRTDIFAFGCVLYEMATGKRCFDGKTKASLVAAILGQDPPPMSTLQPVTPRPFERLVKRCLAKNPEDRWQSPRDVLLELRSIAEPQPEDASTRPRRGAGGWIAAGILALVCAGLALVHFRERPAVDRTLKLTVPLPENSLPYFAEISPDGRRLALALVFEGTVQIYLRSLDSEKHQPLTGTKGARSPFWSPDGRFLGFFADNKLKVISAAGGPARVLCGETGEGRGGTWSRQGVILFGDSGGRLRRVDAKGGECSFIARQDPKIWTCCPVFLPDGHHFFYVRAVSGDLSARGVYLATLAEPTGRRMLADNSSVVYTPPVNSGGPAHLLFLRENTLMAQPFDQAGLEPLGDPFAVADGADNSISHPQVAASAAADGTLVYGFRPRRDSQLTWFDRTGRELGKVGAPLRSSRFALSPDGNTVARLLYQPDGSSSLWLQDLIRGSESRMTVSTPVRSMAWSPDSKIIWLFTLGPEGVYVRQADRNGAQLQLVQKRDWRGTLSDWSRDGRFLVYTAKNPKTQGDLWYVPVESGKPGEKAVQLLGTEAMESQGQFSPDGRWLAYYSDETGKAQVHVRSFPAGSAAWTVSLDGRSEPRWRADGKELFFVSRPPSKLMAASVEADGSGGLRFGTPRKLFEVNWARFAPYENVFGYSPHPDGKRFLVNALVGTDEPAVNVITNWHKAAERR